MKLRQLFENPESRSLVLTILLILFVRGHMVEPFKIPSGSMIPTILIGDHLFVSKSSYRIHIPFTNTEVLRVSEPKRSDVVVFEYPNHEKDEGKLGYYYIKRLIGVPGDKIKVVGGVPYINGSPAKQEPIAENDFPKKRSPSFEPNNYSSINYLETLPGTTTQHLIQRYRGVLETLPAATEHFRLIHGSDCIPVGSGIFNRAETQGMGPNNICEFEVPQDKFFVMGDNRDDSQDGRDWGFVDRKLMIGKALFIWLSCKQEGEEGGGLCILPWNWRWNRIGLPMR